MTYVPGGGSGGGTIATSGDVALSNPVNGEILSYDSAIAKWKNAASASNTATLKAVNLYDSSTSSYPARPTGYGSVEWIGPVDPGTAALEFDTWLNTTV